ncbi:MAG: arsenate reductase family protein [Mycoplasmoidaceae bacterium]
MFYIITKSNCESCKKVLRYFNYRGIKFNEINTEWESLPEQILELMERIPSLDTGKFISLNSFVRTKGVFFQNKKINPLLLSSNELRQIVKSYPGDTLSFPIILFVNNNNIVNYLVGFSEDILNEWLAHPNIIGNYFNLNKNQGDSDCCIECIENTSKSIFFNAKVDINKNSFNESQNKNTSKKINFSEKIEELKNNSSSIMFKNRFVDANDKIDFKSINSTLNNLDYQANFRYINDRKRIFGEINSNNINNDNPFKKGTLFSNNDSNPGFYNSDIISEKNNNDVQSKMDLKPRKKLFSNFHQTEINNPDFNYRLINNTDLIVKNDEDIRGFGRVHRAKDFCNNKLEEDNNIIFQQKLNSIENSRELLIDKSNIFRKFLDEIDIILFSDNRISEKNEYPKKQFIDNKNLETTDSDLILDKKIIDTSENISLNIESNFNNKPKIYDSNSTDFISVLPINKPSKYTGDYVEDIGELPVSIEINEEIFKKIKNQDYINKENSNNNPNYFESAKKDICLEKNIDNHNYFEKIVKFDMDELEEIEREVILTNRKLISAHNFNKD